VTARALVGSPVVMLGREKIILSAPLRRSRGQIMVPPDFTSKVFSRMLGKPPEGLPPARPFRIILDPGHGGKDPGAIGVSGTREKDVVLDVAKRLRADLRRDGFDVRMTRTDDEFISLERRTELATQMMGDLYISIHANSSSSGRASGLEVYSLKDLSWQEKTEDERIKNQNAFFGHLAMEHNDQSLRKIVSDMMFNYKMAESADFANYIGEGLSRELRAKDRGSQRAGFFVLRNTLMPAVLVEIGFLSNSREERLLNSGPYRQRVADGLAESIRKYVNSRIY
jgi:N-acetylmuramoyl-L-alanine amidase